VVFEDMWKELSLKQDHGHALHPFFDISYLKQEHTRKLRTNTLTQYLLPWKNLPIEDAISMDEDFIQQHPKLPSIEDNAYLKTGGMLCP
jgi:outer membrane protein assembly factor BamD (BamD/ComL family)